MPLIYTGYLSNKISSMFCFYDTSSRRQVIAFFLQTLEIRLLHFLHQISNQLSKINKLQSIQQITQSMMKNQSSMKSIKSMKGLSEIMEESERDQNLNTKIELAKLANEEFLSYYFQLTPDFNIYQQYKQLLSISLPETFQKFRKNQIEEKQELFKKEVKRQFQIGIRANLEYLQKDQLKKIAQQKIKQQTQKQQLSSSRKQKEEIFYERLKSSRKKVAQPLITAREETNIKSNQESPTKDMMTEQSAQDLFFRLDSLGEKRDMIKRNWYSLQQSMSKQQQKRKCFEEWRKHLKIMQELVKLLLEKINKEIGTIQVFYQLNSSENNLLTKSPNRSKSMQQYEKSLAETRMNRTLSLQQTKMINRFNTWNNKLILDQRQIEFIWKEMSLI